jgi:hypothetical protein
MLDSLIQSLEMMRKTAQNSAQTAGSKELREWYYGLAHGLLHAIDLCREKQRQGEDSEVQYLRAGLRQIADAAKDQAHPNWIASTAEARLRGEEFVNLPTQQ